MNAIRRRLGELWNLPMQIARLAGDFTSAMHSVADSVATRRRCGHLLVAGRDLEGRPMMFGQRVTFTSDTVVIHLQPQRTLDAGASVFLIGEGVDLLDVSIGTHPQSGAPGAMPFVVTRDPCQLGQTIACAVSRMR